MITRKPLRLLMLAALVLVSGAAIAAPAAGQPTVRLRRFVLLAGVDDGGPTRTKLRYAASDAKAMSRVLQTLGGVAAEDVVFVSTANRAAFDAGFADIEQRLRAGVTPGVRRELLVYYSGHSDEDGLMIGRDRVGYDELRARVQKAPADLRVVILDSCASGAFTRRKGGVKRAPFLMDASTDMRGHAFLTSSAADERAQESDRIAASFFTHYLVSGLRGAADANQDKRVTLQEAYQFASQETLARTERSQAGPQHAAYEFDLAGTGDMVVTDVRGTQSGLVLTPELGGRITVREANGALVAELRKPAGNTIELGLEPGNYVVAMDSGSTIFQASVTLAAGKHTPLAAQAFRATGPREATVARGDDLPATAGAADATATATPAMAPAAHTTAFKATLFPSTADGLANVRGFSIGLVADRARHVHGLQLAVGWAQSDAGLTGLQMAAGATLIQGPFEGVQMAAGATVLRGEGRGLQMAGGGSIVDGRFVGLQMAGAITTASEYLKGVQLAGGATYAGSALGLQMAGGVNLAKSFVGVQAAPVNYAGTMDGLQLGVVNLSKAASGFRLGVVNATGASRGFQLGVINVAKHEEGESFALINIVGNGIHNVSLFSTDVMLSNIGVKLGGRHLYTNLIAGYQPGDELAPGTGPEQFSAGTKRFATGVGIGWRFPLERGPLTFGELEADWLQVNPVWDWLSSPPGLGSLRVQAGLRLAPQLVLLAGAGVNVSVATDGRDLDLSRVGPQSVARSGDTTVRIYPGLLLGLQI
jgi:hypothetical protein